MAEPLNQAAIFVDFENIYYFIKNRPPEPADPADAAITTVRNLRKSLLEESLTQCIVQHAYADFERIAGSSQGAFYLSGVETHNVLGTDHKNAADMRLCIDAMDTLYTRSEINTFIFVAGDRDYIPVVQHLRKHAKHVLVASFKGSISGDLLQVAEERNFIDLSTFMPKIVSVVTSEKPVVVSQEKVTQPSGPKTRTTTAVSTQQFNASRSLTNDSERDALHIMLRDFGDKPEIWLTPYLRKQRSEMSQLAEYERRMLITELTEKGAIRVEKRPGDEGEFSVIVLNWNHPDVQDLNP